MFAEVIINTTAKGLQQAFTYTVPDKLAIRVGSRVLVPFGHRQEEGIVVALREKLAQPVSFTLKPITSLLAVSAGFQEEMLQTALWLRDYYVCNLADALRLFLVDKKGLVRKTVFVPGHKPPRGVEEMAVFQYVWEKGKASKTEVGRRFSIALVTRMLKAGSLAEETEVHNALTEKKEAWLCFHHADSTGLLKRRKRQRELLAWLAVHQEGAVQDLEKLGFSRQLMQKLAATGLAIWESRPARTKNILPHLAEEKGFELTQEQKQVLQVIGSLDKYKTYILHGITGSGKTEIYLRLSEKALRNNQQVIVLVPEIALTGQIVRRFLHRFQEEVVVMHSKLSQGEKRNNARRMQLGESHICIGARSAVFAPVQNLGLIIVDEAHDSSYKQDEAPRYQAVAVAQKRAQYYQCPVILGSATPAVNDYYRAKSGQYTLLELTERVGKKPLPTVKVVDMREELARGNYRVISDALLTLLEETLQAKQQAIILLNRRGFSTFVMCRKCGYVVKCDTCDVAMVYHQHAQVLKCHYCEATKPVPTLCPSCGSKYIKFFGSGTEKVEEQLHKLLPKARIVRLDQDTTRRKNSGDQIIEAFRRHEYDILLGTQMVAKGHDFPNVTAVGILAADSLLNIPAYWAGERTFQLLTQAAGRAGRGAVPGRVVMQTYAPEHYVIQCAAKQDYQQFYQQEIAFRQELSYPPFQEMTKLYILDADEKKNWQKAQGVEQALSQWNKENGTEVEIIGPYEDVIKKIRNKYRLVLVLRGKDLTAIKKAMQTIKECWQNGVIIDVDPSF